MCERNAPRGAYHELDAQALFQRVDAPANNGGGYALSLRGGSKAAFGGDSGEGFKLFEFIHALIMARGEAGCRKDWVTWGAMPHAACAGLGLVGNYGERLHRQKTNCLQPVAL